MTSPERQCGDCQLCCKLLPVADGVAINGVVQFATDRTFHKPAGQRCKYQRHHKGCAVYNTSKMPHSCSMWNCRWLVNDDTAELRRPDRSHYVIDLMPDYVTAVDNESGKQQTVPAIQVWVDPSYPDAHHEPALRAYLLRRAEQEGAVAIIRLGSHRGLVLIPPPVSGLDEWIEYDQPPTEQTHTAAEIIQALGAQHDVA